MTPPLRRRRVRRYFGLYRATVVNVTDPAQSHRVQVSLPSISATTSSWAPTIRDLAGRPQVGDEVLVGFEAGELESPYVVGVLTTAATAPVEISDENGNSVRLSTTGIDISAGSEVRITASRVHLSSGAGTVDAGIWKFSGVVQSDTVITNSVIAASYSPGAGNVM